VPTSINFSISVSEFSHIPIGILSGQVPLILQFEQGTSQSLRELPDAYVSSIYNKLLSVPIFANRMPRSVSLVMLGAKHTVTPIGQEERRTIYVATTQILSLQ
jgi:hypothetical protein